MSHAKELASQQIVPDFSFYELDWRLRELFAVSLSHSKLEIP